MKVCKQCRRLLGDECFRPVKSRGTGQRRSTPGVRALCRSCESMNVRAHRLVEQLDKGLPVDSDKLQEVRRHYQMLLDARCDLTTAAARRLMGFGQTKTVDTADTVDLNELYGHIAKLRDRSYASFEEAEAEHQRLIPALRAAGLYAEANDIVDGWFLE